MIIKSYNLSDYGDKQQRADKTASPLCYCIIDFRVNSIIRSFGKLLRFGIIVLWRRRIRSVPLMELP